MPLYAAMLVPARAIQIKSLLSKPLLRPVSTVQVYTRQFTCTSVQLHQAMCVRYNWAKQSVFALPSTALR
jgi:hypothetical protein